MAFEDMREFLDWLGEAFSQWDANDLLGMLATWQAADVSAHQRFRGNLSAALGSVSCRALVMPCRTDLYFPPEDSAIAVSMMPNAELGLIESDSEHLAGHPGFGTDEDDAFIDAGLQ